MSGGFFSLLAFWIGGAGTTVVAATFVEVEDIIDLGYTPGVTLAYEREVELDYQQTVTLRRTR